jgi:hypothetical protein
MASPSTNYSEKLKRKKRENLNKTLSDLKGIGNKKLTLNKKDADPAREPSQDPGIEAGQAKARERIRKIKEKQAEEKAAVERAKMKITPSFKEDTGFKSGKVRVPVGEANVKTPKIELSPRPKTKTKTKTETKTQKSAPAWKNYKSVSAAQNAKTPSKYYMGSDGKKKLAVTKEQLNRKSGETLTQAYNRYEGKTPSKSSGASSSAKATDGDSGKKSFRQRRAARLEKRIASGSGSDSRKAIQRKRLERVKKRIEDSKKKPVNKMGGGMMKSKMASKGGKMGGKMPGGMKAGGMAKKGYAKGGAAFPDLTGDGKVTQKDILKGRGVSGMKKGGMAKKGYSKGGAAMKSKGGTKRGKPKGVGAALRGYGKAMR